MNYQLILACLSIGLMIGAILAYLRGYGNNNSSIISFIFGTLLGGSSSLFLRIEDTPSFIFSIKILGSVATGVFLGLILTTSFMECIYTRESNRARIKENQKTS